MFSPKNRLVFLLIIFFLLANVHVASAGDLADCAAEGLISPSQAITCMLESLGITEESIKEMTKAADTTKWKKFSPQVTLTFLPANPVPGEKATASALPTNFNNQVDAQYFTWYLQTADCPPSAKFGELDGKDEKKYKKGSALDKKCNLSGNYDGDYGIVDVEDYKIKAMRIYAGNGFDWESADYNSPSNVDDGFHATLGGADQKGKDNHCYFYGPNSGNFFEFQDVVSGDNECFHLFPGGNETGNGTFSKSEEEFWHTNPIAPDTAETGHPDEANVVGLGAKDFSWAYQAGDKVGVAVEGVAVDATIYTDSSYKIMWAYLNNNCDYLGLLNGAQREPEDGSCVKNCESNKTYMNQCLQDNMLAPTEGGGANEKIDVSLSFSPENPVNDTSADGDNADWINVISIIGNSTKTDSLHYDWKVYAGQFADADGEWGVPLLKSNLIGVEQTVGTGIPNLKFKANFGDETPDVSGTSKVPKYLKVKLNVSEKVTSATGGTRLGLAEVVIPLSSFSNQLSVFNTTVSDSGDSPTILQNTDKICQTYAATNKDTLVDTAVCQVAPDEIIAVKADIVPDATQGETLANFDFLWTLNGSPLSYKYDSTYKSATFKPGKLIFFPVLSSKDTTLNLSLVATSQDTGRKISLTKVFLVSEPSFKIISTDKTKAKPKLLGKYIDLDGKSWPDYSQTEFLALADSAIELKVEPFAAFPLPDDKDLSLNWYQNDSFLSATGRTLSFSPTGAAGDSFSLKAEGVYTQDIPTKKALRDYWDVSLNEYYEQRVSQKIDFSVVDAAVFGEAATAKNGQQKILASFISSVPAYFAFLFRIVMTAFVMLAAIWILFILFPQAQKND